MRIASAAGMTLALCAVVALAGCNKKDKAAAGGNGAAASASADGAQATSSASAGPLTLADMPKRKAGLWRITNDIGEVHHQMVMEQCVDAESDAKMAVWGQGMSKDMCSKTDLSRGADGSIHFASTCSIAGGTTESSGDVSGDFQSHYTVRSEGTTTGSSVAAANKHHIMTMDAQWIGPCKPGQKGGDTTVNGMTIHMGDMMNHAAPAK